MKKLIFIFLLAGIFSVGANAVLAAGPSITSSSASGVTQTTATLNGIVNPNGSTINVWYQDKDGVTVPGSQVNGITGNSDVTLPPFSLSGLTASTSYIYKLVATDGPNIVNADIAFTTLAAPSGGGGGGGGGGCGTLATISSLSPSSVTAGAGATVVTINGTNFSNGISSALFNSIAKTTNFINATQITMNLLASDVASAGNANVIVANGSGCNSNTATFTINPVSSGGGSGGGSNGGGGNGGGGSTSNGSGGTTTPPVITTTPKVPTTNSTETAIKPKIASGVNKPKITNETGNLVITNPIINQNETDPVINNPIPASPELEANSFSTFGFVAKFISWPVLILIILGLILLARKFLYR